MGKIYLGKLGQTCCWTANSAPNSSILIQGISGSGKTTHILEMEQQTVISNPEAIVIAIDTGHSHTQSEIAKLQPHFHFKNINRISARSDGLNISLLNPIMGTSTGQQREPGFMHINATTNALATPLGLGSVQTAILREGISFATKRSEDYDSEAIAIVAGLNRQGQKGLDVYNRLWAVLNCDAIRIGNNKMTIPGKINIIDLNDYDDELQRTLTEILLSYLFRKTRYTHSDTSSTYYIFIDECQRFSMGKNSAICHLLCEGRKFGINLILATQTTAIFNKETLAILNQASTKLYFRPAQADTSIIAKKLSPTDWKIWMQRLSNLQVGECIASGIFNIDGQDISRPLLLR